MAPTLTLKRPEVAIAKLSNDYVAAKVIATAPQQQPKKKPAPQRSPPQERKT
jgi:hypothetical protein